MVQSHSAQGDRPKDLLRRDAIFLWFDKLIITHHQAAEKPSVCFFLDDNLYDFEVWIAYTRSKQTETVAVLVGSEDLAEEYVHPSGDIYMVRGHLSPKADFQFTSWQVCKNIIRY